MSTVAGISTAWLIARAAGFVAFGALTLSVWLGLAHEHAALRHAPGSGRCSAWHRMLAGTGLAMLALHVGALLFDPVVHFGLVSALVPFAAPWRPAAVAAGVVAAWLMVALTVSFRLRTVDRPARLAPAALRELRRVRARARPRARVGHRSRRHRRTDPRGRRRRPRALADLRSASSTPKPGVAAPAPARRPTPSSTTTPRSTAMTFRIIIDRSICNGYGACVDIDPADFAIGDDGIAIAAPDRGRPGGRARGAAPVPDGRDHGDRRGGVEVR